MEHLIDISIEDDGIIEPKFLTPPEMLMAVLRVSDKAPACTDVTELRQMVKDLADVLEAVIHRHA